MNFREKAVRFTVALVTLAAFRAGPAVSAPPTCRAKLQIGGAAVPGNGRSARCIDGDPACDSDGTADGGCEFRASLCFDSNGGSCSSDDLNHASIVPGPGFEAISAAFDELKGEAAPVCTAGASVRVSTHGRRKGRAVLKMSTGKAAERLTFVCQPSKRSAGSVTFATIQKKVFDATCATPSCHGAAAAAGALNLSSGAAFGNLVGVSATNPAALAAGAMRVVPGDPDRSFLVRKLMGQLGVGEGSRMPLVGTPLSPSTLDMLRRWIAAGASETAPF